MLSEEDIKHIKSTLKENKDYIFEFDDDNIKIEYIVEYIDQLENENINLKQIHELGLNKEKQYCFNEDGHTGKCLGYGNDEPCNYCKGCERLSIREDD